MNEFVKVQGKEAVARLLNEFCELFPHIFEKIESLDAYADKINNFANVYAARNENGNFGIAVFYANDINEKKAYISLIGIKKEMQGSGQGGWLLSCCEAVAAENGMTQVLLEVDSDNSTAIRFYEKHGYVFVSHTDRSSMYMKKDLI